MHSTILKLYLKFHDLTNSEDGQDLVEYALLLTMISLALIAAINGLASSVNNVFANVSSTLA